MNEPSSFRSLSSELAHRVDAFEAALAADARAEFDHLLPDRAHPLYLPLLGELIRVDLEHSWTAGRGKRLAEYTARYPAVLEDATLLGSVAFEEFRQRRWAGEEVLPVEYAEVYALDVSDWPVLPPGSEPSASNLLSGRLARTSPIHTPPPTGGRANGLAVTFARPEECRTGRVEVKPVTDHESQAVSRWQEAAEALPAPGVTFLGFRLVEELGRGAFGRVYLARQGDLAGRPVALKVACDAAVESQTLAQMQHTNIVPIYSFHRAGPFQAVCMPFFGRTTLARVVRHISDRPALPSSGRELRSTLNLGGESTAPATWRSADTGSDKSPAVPEPPAPAEVAPTAADGWSKLDGLSYIEVVLTLGGQLADGLGHAHRRGILHRDLKPANVLLTDDGRPMLLDFNLAEDTKGRAAADRAAVGGTLPYMAPEHIEAYRTGSGRLDERCDLFSLGVILFELLTGRHPYPIRKGGTKEATFAMVADRRNQTPRLRPFNAAVSPAVEALVRKCLAPNPADRYQSAEQLREDIDRHLGHRPLKHAANPSTRERIRKWARRHPRATSSAAVATAAGVLIATVVAGAAYARERTRGLEVRGRLAEHQAAFRDAQSFLDDRKRSWPRLDEGLGQLRGVLARYGVPDDPGAGDAWLNAPALRHLPDAERERVRHDVGETFYLMAQVATLKAQGVEGPERAAEAGRAAAWNELAERYGGARLARAAREQRAAVAELRGDPATAERLRREAEETPAEAARDLYLLGSQFARQNRFYDALRHLERATQLDPENHSAWFVRGSAHLALQQYDFAAMCFGACVSLRPHSAPAWLNRGIAFAGLRFHRYALEDFARALRLDPTLTDAYVERAAVRHAEGDLAAAEEDYGRALETGKATVRVYFLRATVRHYRGDAEGAKADRDAGFKHTPADEMSWIARAENRAGDDPKGALGDVAGVLKLNPMSVYGLQLKAHLLGERLGRPDDALAVLDRAVGFHPDHVPTRAGRAVALARAGKRDAAHTDAKEAERRDTRGPNLYQLACVYALTAKTHPEDKREAFRLLWGGLRTGFGLDLVRSDTDLDALRSDKDFQDLVKDAEALHAPRTPRRSRRT